MSYIVLFCVFVELKVGIILVDGVVGQVHAHVIQVVSMWDLVLLSSEPSHAILV